MMADVFVCAITTRGVLTMAVVDGAGGDGVISDREMPEIFSKVSKTSSCTLEIIWSMKESSSAKAETWPPAPVCIRVTVITECEEGGVIKGRWEGKCDQGVVGKGGVIKGRKNMGRGEGS